MFGYVNVNQPELKIREYTRYKGYYCGLCSSLKKNYGTSAGLSLSYDITFLIMLLTSLYEPGTSESMKRCQLHPVQKHLELSNKFSDYGADMNLICAWYTALDHKQDKDSKKKQLKANGLSVLFRKYFRTVKEKYPDKIKNIEAATQELKQLEEENCQDLDRMAGLSGRIVAELFHYRDDEWTETLCKIGDFLGRFIYIMDAWEDYPEDKINGCYNPMQSMFETTGSQNVFDELCYSILNMLMAECTACFERLPLIEDAEILRNILYAGVWTRYHMIREKRNRK